MPLYVRCIYMTAMPAAGCTVSHQAHPALQQCMYAKCVVLVPLLMC